MSNQKTPPPDTFVIRCPKLGHQIHFSYCRRENLGLPCQRVLTCWYAYFSVEPYLRDELTEQEWQDTFRPAKPKVLTLAELIEQAQKRKEGEKK